MALIIDVHDIKHEQLGDDELDGDQLDSAVDTHSQDPQPGQPASRVQLSLSSISKTIGTSKRTRFVTAMVALLTIVVVTVGVVLTRNSPTSTEANTTTPDIIVTPQAKDPIPFLQLSVESNTNLVFVLSKVHWNASFMVSPTVIKHSAPPHEGMERGTMLLTTTEYTFHFERSQDDRFLLLVCENHLARLNSPDDELKQVFEDSQWPGYFTRVAIYTETDDTIQFPADAFFAHGFFVSAMLMSPYYSVIPGGSTAFPRNSNFQIEYELDDGILWVNYAVGMLPATPMNQRVADDRIGYFMQRYMRFGVDNNDPKKSSAEAFQYMGAPMTVINRQRLERDPMTGETIQPIVYYIDPSVPTRWRRAFADGVLAWAPAFESIGFKGAIKAVLPGDAEWPQDYSLGDVQYNSISVMLSDSTYASGQFVSDPRSGEILNSNIIFEYGFFDDVVADFDLRSPLGPPSISAARPSTARPSKRHKPRQCGIGKSSQHQLDRMVTGMLLGTKMSVIPDAVIARHFTDIVMHEVGHTLGLRHNFAGSSLVSRANLVDKDYTSVHGLSASIMDYVPINIYSDLTQTEATSHDYYQSTIGDYDMAAIAYGYSIIVDERPGFKHEKLSQIAQHAPLFLTDEDIGTKTNPYAQRFDLSSDPIDFGNDRLELIKLLRKSSILVNKIAEDASWSDLWRYEHVLFRMINTTVEMIQPFLGGVNATHAHRKRGEMAYTVQYIPRETQLRALRVLARIIGADDGVFPSPAEYGSYIQVQGFDGEDCDTPSNDYGCLARSLVNMDEAIGTIRMDTIRATLFPVLDRIIAQDVNSPLSITDVLGVIENATSANGDEPRNQIVYTFYRDGLLKLVKDENEDSRLRKEIAAFLNATNSSAD